MKSFGAVLIMFILLITGCQQKANGLLDTTNLKQVEPGAEELSGVPYVYEAPTLEEGLAALPFEVTLPKELPFESMPIKLTGIEDFKHDGKELRVEFMTVSKNREDYVILTITVHNFKVEYAEPAGEDVQLTNGVIGNYKGNSLIFEKDELYYGIGYNNENITPEQHKKQMIDIANQMF